MSSRYVLQEICRGQYRFKLATHTGQVLLISGVIMDKESALRKIASTHDLARNSRNYALLTDEGGECYFAIVTQKGEELAYSVTSYPDAESRQAGINLVKSNTRGAGLEDQTQSPQKSRKKP